MSLHISDTKPTTARVIGLCPKQVRLVVRPFGDAATIVLADAEKRVKDHALATGMVEIAADGDTARLVNVLPPADIESVRDGHSHLIGFGYRAC